MLSEILIYYHLYCHVKLGNNLEYKVRKANHLANNEHQCFFLLSRAFTVLIITKSARDLSGPLIIIPG